MTQTIGFDEAVQRYQGRDFGLVFVGIIVGIIMLLFLFWYRGGRPALSPMTSLFDRFTGGSVTPTPTPGRPGQGLEPTRPPATGGGGGGGGQIMRVKLNNLSMHRCPGYDCETVATLPLGSQVIMTGERDASVGEEWVKIRAGSREGWVSRYYLE